MGVSPFLPPNFPPSIRTEKTKQINTWHMMNASVTSPQTLLWHQYISSTCSTVKAFESEKELYGQDGG
jgi:hypothetical protein